MFAVTITGNYRIRAAVLVSYCCCKNHHKWLKTTQMYQLILLQVRSLHSVSSGRVFCLGQNEGIGRATFLFGGSEGKSASKPIRVSAEFTYLVVVRLRSSFFASCPQEPGFCLEATLFPSHAFHLPFPFPLEMSSTFHAAHVSNDSVSYMSSSCRQSSFKDSFN